MTSSSFNPRIGIVLAILAMAFLMNTAMAVSYIRPDESKELFKVEKIPLQVGGLQDLARHLVVIAQREQEDTALNQRAAGQLLTLAIRLDPTNQDARKTNRALVAGRRPEASPADRVRTAKARVRYYHRWLTSTEAGTDANLLAGFLTDATKTLSPDTAKNEDTANWEGVLPALKRYTLPREAPKPPITQRPKEAKDTEKMPTAPTAKFHIPALSVRVPLRLQTYQKYPDAKNPKLIKTRTISEYGVSTVQIKLRPCKPGENASLIIRTIARSSNPLEIKNDPIYNTTAATLLALLKNRHSALSPVHSELVVSGGDYARSNNLALTAPAALMLEASVKNAPLRKDLHLCAIVDQEGNLTLPENFWSYLRHLRKSTSGGRLIVPSAASELLTQLLVYGKPDFFTRWEVITADTLDEALAAATKKSATELTQAHDYFETVRSLTKKSSVTQLAVNRAVRARLAAILKLAPNHLSSRILLIQGGGKRPMRLSEEALAHELLPVVRKMNHALMHEINISYLSTSMLKNLHTELRASLAGLDRLVDRSHDALYKDVLRQANEFRRLMSMAKRISADIKDTHEIKKSNTLFFSMQRDSELLLEKNLRAIGVVIPEKPKEVKPK